jgi:hypothetical protein
LRILNTTRNTLLADQAKLADTPISRLVGLLNRESLQSDEALVIAGCQSIHMLFMRFPIDVVFLDRACRVVGLVRAIKPFRFSPVFFAGYYAVEGPVGMIERSATEKGDSLRLEVFSRS